MGDIRKEMECTKGAANEEATQERMPPKLGCPMVAWILYLKEARVSRGNYSAFAIFSNALLCLSLIVRSAYPMVSPIYAKSLPLR